MSSGPAGVLTAGDGNARTKIGPVPSIKRGIPGVCLHWKQFVHCESVRTMLFVWRIGLQTEGKLDAQRSSRVCCQLGEDGSA